MTHRLCLGRLALVAALLFATSCVSLSLAGEKVPITRHESGVEGCRYLREVEAHPPYCGPRDAMYTLRNEAGKLGAGSSGGWPSIG